MKMIVAPHRNHLNHLLPHPDHNLYQQVMYLYNSLLDHNNIIIYRYEILKYPLKFEIPFTNSSYNITELFDQKNIEKKYVGNQ